MANLFTRHDPYHVHKILGLLALLHYLHRSYLLCATGTAFPPKEYDPIASRAAYGVVVHGLLSWSSLLLPLPRRRNFSKPMIWPEFRLHSILFATRHVVSTLLSLTGFWPSGNDVVWNCLARAAVILGTVEIANLITQKWGCRENRTTNAMPYPEHVSEEQRLAIRRLYTSAQFGATVTALMDDPNMNFAPLLGIQMAPLLMTLVRKGKISTGTYHRTYSLSLTLGYVVIFSRLLGHAASHQGAGALFRALMLYQLPFSRCRRAGISARAFWMVTILASTALYPFLLEGWVEAHVSMDMLWKFTWFGFVTTMVKQTTTYAPLFVGSVDKESSLSKSHQASRVSWYGLHGVLWSCGLFWFVQCCTAREAGGEVTGG